LFLEDVVLRLAFLYVLKKEPFYLLFEAFSHRFFSPGNVFIQRNRCVKPQTGTLSLAPMLAGRGKIPEDTAHIYQASWLFRDFDD
jgi:hypothetical protein